MTFSTRLLPSLFLSALASAALLSACSDTESTAFCDDENPCSNGEVCNSVSKACEPVADAGEIAPDANLGVCEGGNQCVAEIPTDWIGPLVYTTADTEPELAACPSAYPDEIGVLGAEMVTTADCECACGTVANAQCSDAVVYPDDGSVLLCGNSSCLGGVCPGEILIPPGATRNASSHSGAQVAARLGRVTSGTCQLPSVNSEFTTGFSSTSRLCATTPLSATCEAGEVCAPTIPVEFGLQRCVAREGEFECVDTGSFTERTVLYASVVDKRECDGSSCTCSSENTSCGGAVTLEAPGNILIASSPGCFDVPSPIETGTIYRNSPNPNPDCRQSGSAVVTSNATATDATTLCCEPEL